MSPKINAKTLKARLTLGDIEQILKAINMPIFSKSNKEWRLYGGCHHVNPYDGNANVAFYPDTKIFVCYVCASSFDIIALVQKRLALTKQPSSFVDALNLILSVTGIDPNIVIKTTSTQAYDWEDKLGRYIRFKRTGSDAPVYDKTILDSLEHSYPQEWIDEGIDVESMEKYQIRYYRRLNQIVIPVFGVGGELHGIRCRNMRPDLLEQAKYIPLTTLDGTTYKFNTNGLFYGINYNTPAIEQTQTVILVESEKACLKADTWFGKDNNVLSLFGSQIGMQRRNQLIKMGVKNVILALDSDFHEIDDEDYEKFEAKMIKLAEMFRGFATVDCVYNNLGFDGFKYSPFDFGREQYEKLFENRAKNI